jgi:hypothetical protein
MNGVYQKCRKDNGVGWLSLDLNYSIGEVEKWMKKEECRCLREKRKREREEKIIANRNYFQF